MPTDPTPTDARLDELIRRLERGTGFRICGDRGAISDDQRDTAAALRELAVLRKAWSVCYEMFGPFDRGNMYDALEDAQKKFTDAD